MSLKPPQSPTSSAGTSSITERLDDLEDAHTVIAAPTGVAATDTAVIQAAITATAVAGVPTRLVLRDGNYAITNLTFPALSDGSVELVGQGSGRTTLTCSASSGYAVTIGDGSATDTRWIFLRDLSLIGNTTADGAVKFNSSRFCGLSRVHIEGFTKAGAIGLYFVEALANYIHQIEHCQFKNIPIGIKFAGTAGIGGNSNTVFNCHFNTHSTYAVYFNGGDGNFLLRNEFNGSITTACFLDNDSDDNVFAFNKWDGPTTSVNVSTANCNGTLLYGNVGTATFADSGTLTMRLDPEAGAVKLPSYITGPLEVSDFTQTLPTDGIGTLGDIRTNGAIRSNSGDAAKQVDILDGYLKGPALASTPAVPRAIGTDANGRLMWVNASNVAMQVASYGRLARTADFTIDGTREYDIIAYTTLAATRTVTLPAANAAGVTGRIYTIKAEVDASVNNLVIQRAGTDTIEGATSVTINTNKGFKRLYSDGTSTWFLL